MTLGYGLGMLAIGMILIVVFGIIMFLITNKEGEEK
jgi:hypothetical protein